MAWSLWTYNMHTLATVLCKGLLTIMQEGCKSLQTIMQWILSRLWWDWSWIIPIATVVVTDTSNEPSAHVCWGCVCIPGQFSSHIGYKKALLSESLATVLFKLQKWSGDQTDQSAGTISLADWSIWSRDQLLQLQEAWKVLHVQKSICLVVLPAKNWLTTKNF